MKNNFNSYFIKIFYYFSILLYLFYILILVIFSNNFGITKSFINISESMMPTIPINSVVVVREQSSYNVDDIISYYSKINERVIVVTHRIIALSGNVYITKGDKNELEDRELVKPRLIIGRVFLIIPLLGNILNFSRSLFGLYFFIILPAFIFIVIEMRNIIFILNIKEKFFQKNK